MNEYYIDNNFVYSVRSTGEVFQHSKNNTKQLFGLEKDLFVKELESCNLRMVRSVQDGFEKLNSI